MFDSFQVRQAYVIHTTLGFIPDIAINPKTLRPEWQGLSAFPEAGLPKQGRYLPRLGELVPSRSPVWPGNKLALPADMQPMMLDTTAWRLSWLASVNLPSQANPSTAVYVYLYPFGVVSIKVVYAIGFANGVEVTEFIHLLRRLVQQDGTCSKTPWLRVTSPWPGVEVTLDDLTDRLLKQLQKAVFQSPTSDQVIRQKLEGVADHLRRHSGLVTDLVRVEPQRFDRQKHAAAFRGVVTLRPRWAEIGDAEMRLKKYQSAPAWTDWAGAWHYAGGLNTVLWHDRLPDGRGRKYRRQFTWLVAHVAELARMEEVLYRYSRDFVVRSAHDELLQLKQNKLKTIAPVNWPRQMQLNEWARFWLKLADFPCALITPDVKRIYTDQAEKLETDQARQAFVQALAEYRQTLSTYTTLGQDVLNAVETMDKVIKAITNITGLIGSFRGGG